MSEAMSEITRHAILGAGGIGGLIGACLAHSGASVTLVVRPEMLDQHPSQLHLKSPFGNFDVPVAVASEVPAVDVLWITVKATQLDSALAAIKNPDGLKAVVPLLNGIDHVALLRAKFGHDGVIPATIAVESERIGPGRIIHRSPFARLNVLSAGRNLLGAAMGDLQRVGFECRFIDDEPTLMWSKLVFLAPFALATTAANKTVGEVFADPKWRREMETCFYEGCSIGKAEGAKIKPEAVLEVMKAVPPNMRSSMQKDVEQHKEPELDAIAGPILYGAKRHGIDVPATQRLVAATQQRGLAR
jgi:2-dehydropantoate 2-reductase